MSGMARHIPEMSMPRAATSVATSTLKWPSRKRLRVTSRCVWETSPWSGCGESGEGGDAQEGTHEWDGST